MASIPLPTISGNNELKEIERTIKINPSVNFFFIFFYIGE